MKEYCIPDCAHNVVHHLSRVLDDLWRYDQYLKDACGDECKSLWKKIADLDNQKKQLLADVIEKKAKEGALKK